MAELFNHPQLARYFTEHGVLVGMDLAAIGGNPAGVRLIVYLARYTVMRSVPPWGCRCLDFGVISFAGAVGTIVGTLERK